MGEDGATHHGNFAPGFLNTIPNLTIAAPLDGLGLETVLHNAISGSGPWVIRYPKSECQFLRNTLKVKLGKMRELKPGTKKAILSFGAIGVNVKEALSGTPYGHFDVTYLKPIDKEELSAIAAKFDEVITVEENSARGGVGDAVRSVISELGLSPKVRSLALPDKFIEHGSIDELHQLCGLDAKSILKFIER